jgi:hypothetical protein
MISSEKELVSKNGLITAPMMDNGKMIWQMEEELWYNLMVLFIRANLSMTMPMVEENIFQVIKKSLMMANFRKTLNMAME